jgi:hypothetical protein
VWSSRWAKHLFQSIQSVPLFIQTINEVGVVELLQKSVIDEVFRICGLCAGKFFRERGEFGLEAFQRGIRLYRDLTFEQLFQDMTSTRAASYTEERREWKNSRPNRSSRSKRRAMKLCAARRGRNWRGGSKVRRGADFPRRLETAHPKR